MLGHKLIHFINYWKHDGDALIENYDALYLPDRFEESGHFSLLPHTAAVRNTVFCRHSVFVFCVILQWTAVISCNVLVSVMMTKPQDSVHMALRQWTVWDPYLSLFIKRPMKRRIPEEGNPHLHHSKKERQCTYKRNIEVRSRNHCCHGKAVNIIYSKCVSLALIIQYAKRLCCSTSRSVACLAVPYFPHYLTNGTTFGKKVVEYEMCVLIYCTTFVWNSCHSKKNLTRYCQ